MKLQTETEAAKWHHQLTSYVGILCKQKAEKEVQKVCPSTGGKENKWETY